MQLEKVYELPLTPAETYAAWVSEKTLIPPVVGLEIDPRVGGRFVLEARGPEGVAVMRGEFCEVEPGRRLRYSWRWMHDPEEVTEVTVEFAPAKGGTHVSLWQTGFLKEESLAAHAAGWDAYAKALPAFVKGKGGQAGSAGSA